MKKLIFILSLLCVTVAYSQNKDNGKTTKKYVIKNDGEMAYRKKVMKQKMVAVPQRIKDSAAKNVKPKN